MEQDLFNFYDVDGNGLITRDELQQVLSVCAKEIDIDVKAFLDQIVDNIFNEAQKDQNGSITFEGLKEVLRKRPNLINELSMNQRRDNLNRAKLARPENGILDVIAKKFPLVNKLKWEYISNNFARFNFFLIMFTISLFLFMTRIGSYWGECGFYILARASGQCLNFFCSVIVLLVCRRSISCLRSRGFGRYLPLDDHVYFHKMFGLFILWHSVSHAAGHVFNYLIKSQERDSKISFWGYLFTTQAGVGWIGHCASITGWILLLIIIIMASAHPFSRSLGRFELFYYTHLLYIPFWGLLFIHAAHFWMWFILPFSIFLIESIIRLRNLLTNLTSTGKTQIIKAVPLPSNVIHLVIKKPQNFEYNPGDWVYVLIPQIAKYEWHPFTISSAPEEDGVIWLHIRAVGEWTRSLRSYFDNLGHRNHLSRFIRSGQFSMSMDQFGADLSVFDSTRILGSNGKPNKSIFKRGFQNNIPSLDPIPEYSSIDSGATMQTASSTLSRQSISNSRDEYHSVSSDSPILEKQTIIDCGNEATTDLSKMITKRNHGDSPITQINQQIPNITIFLDGPYGSPSSQIFRAEHAVLIATGIGVTPFASILQSIVHHYEKRRQKCPSCACEFLDNRPPIVCKLRKVDFVWINRDQKSFEWFIKLLAELELTQSSLPPHERFLDIHIHLTAMEPAQIKSMGLQLALYLIHEKNNKDLVTGLKTRTKAGRPDWDEFFGRIEEQKKGKVSVFFCGRPQLGRYLHRQCDKLGFKFRKEIF